MHKPVLGSSIRENNQPIPSPVNKFLKPVIYKKPKEDTWAFSFKYFNQIEYFGLDRSRPEWFVSLLERLKDLCGKDKESFFKSYSQRNDYKYHTIDFSLKNVPIKRKDLNWVEKEIIENEDEFPLYQFKVSKGKGRIVGFWNVDSIIFYIVLLDPLHNIQPSKDYDYKVDDCHPLSCEYSSIQKDLDDMLREPCINGECKRNKKFCQIPTKSNQANAVLMFLDDDFLDLYKDTLQRKSISEIIEAGVMQLT